MKTLEERAKGIRLVCTDVDGVLTDGALHYSAGPAHDKSFNVRDGAGIKWLQRAGIPVAFISGLASPATLRRAEDLAVEDCVAGRLEKGPVLAGLCAKYGLRPEQVAHLGDDLADLPLLVSVGLACCPEDAVAEVQAAAHWVVPVPGGMGVLRAVAEFILKAQGHWDGVVAAYGKRLNM
ncbi:MAG: HAD hydrolase family protein [Holophaga sp.]|nr:HAD hydrolase family protein [Holophaga sp.]